MHSQPTDLPQPSVDEIALPDVMQALGDRTRLAIVDALHRDGERQCGSFEFGISKATRSHHFKVLREAGLTDTRIEGAARFVRLRESDLDTRFPGLLAAVISAADV